MNRLPGTELRAYGPRLYYIIVTTLIILQVCAKAVFGETVGETILFLSFSCTLFYYAYWVFAYAKRLVRHKSAGTLFESNSRLNLMMGYISLWTFSFALRGLFGLGGTGADGSWIIVAVNLTTTAAGLYAWFYILALGAYRLKSIELGQRAKFHQYFWTFILNIYSIFGVIPIYSRVVRVLARG